MPKVVTANTLDTGTVVFLGRDGWVGSLAEAQLFDGADSADVGLDRAKADADRAIVVEPFVTDAGPEQDGRPKMHLRDTIRAYGPTINFMPSAQKRA